MPDSKLLAIAVVGLSGFVFLSNIGLLFIPEVSADARIKAQKKERNTGATHWHK